MKIELVYRAEITTKFEVDDKFKKLHSSDISEEEDEKLSEEFCQILADKITERLGECNHQTERYIVERIIPEGD